MSAPEASAAAPALRPGDKVSIVAPASQLRGADVHLLDQAVALLRSWSLDPVVRVERSHHFYLAGDDEARSSHLAQALLSPDERALFCTRGGYGTARLLPALQGLAPERKTIVGYSDLTALQLQAQGAWPHIASIHGPNIATRQLLGDEPECEANRSDLFEALFTRKRFKQELLFITDGRAAGPIVGGCLSVLVSLVGTPFMPDLAGSILFLEDAAEPPYRIDRMLTQLISGGHLDMVAGIVFGKMHRCVDPYNDLTHVLTDLFRSFRFPIAFGLESGHGPRNRAIRLAAPTVMDSEAGSIDIT